MTIQNKKQLSLLLYEYYKELSQTCEYDCNNCELGVLESYGSGHSCSVEVVERNLDEELYEIERQRYK